jgi:hypothetical protein
MDYTLLLVALSLGFGFLLGKGEKIKNVKQRL